MLLIRRYANEMLGPLPIPRSSMMYHTDCLIQRCRDWAAPEDLPRITSGEIPQSSKVDLAVNM